MRLNLWDTAGQEKFRSLTRMYYQDAAAAVIVYDSTFRESFDTAARWIQDLREHCSTEGLVIALAANKCDLYD